MRHLILLLMVVGLGLAACDTRPEQVNATSSSVTYKVGPDDGNRADAMAMEYCQKKTGRQARRHGITEYGSSQQITYQCE
jgi:hypothetical protein